MVFKGFYFSGKRVIRRNPKSEQLSAIVIYVSQSLIGVAEPAGGNMIGSRIAFVFLFVCGLVALRSLGAQQKDASWAGWISDEACGPKHTKAGGSDCVQKCWRGGASVGHPEWKPQRAVFVADDARGIGIVDNPQPVRNFPAGHVVLAGKFDPAKKTVHVEKVASAAQ